jgi:hypothetical protein
MYYTAISYCLYIVSFLLIVGGNIFLLISVGIGNVAGVYYSMMYQQADVVFKGDLQEGFQEGFQEKFKNEEEELKEEQMSGIKTDLNMLLPPPSLRPHPHPHFHRELKAHPTSLSRNYPNVDRSSHLSSSTLNFPDNCGEK